MAVRGREMQVLQARHRHQTIVAAPQALFRLPDAAAVCSKSIWRVPNRWVDSKVQGTTRLLPYAPALLHVEPGVAYGLALEHAEYLVAMALVEATKRL